MMLAVILGAIALCIASGLAAAFAWRDDARALAIGTVGVVAACAIGLAAALVALVSWETSSAVAPWQLPAGALHVALDPLSALFVASVFLVSGLAAIYGRGYLASAKRRLAPCVAFFAILVAAMALVAIAHDGILFLVAWEAMSIASFFLVTFDNDRDDVRRAGLTYLIASHLGVVFLFALFVMLRRHAGSYDFDAFVASGTPGGAGALFLVATIGFGTKAGFWPVHVWLPDAHPAAPSHVSAVMSGVMIKLGIYGLLRTLAFLGPPHAWWGLVLIAIGSISAITGILNALGQRDLKRRLAYSSVENIGIITLAIGLGVIGRSEGNATVASLAFGGALIHVINHGLFKGLLFQGAGAILHATGTRELDALGGLAKKMPRTSSTFLAGALAICALPPMNGFVGEWLIYVGAFTATTSFPTALAVAALVIVPVLAIVGGVALACFVSAYGAAFLGEPRSDATADAHDPNAAMMTPMVVGAMVCLTIGVAPGVIVWLVSPSIEVVAGAPWPLEVDDSLFAITRIAIALAAIIFAFAWLRARLLRTREVVAAPTWGCGYAAPTARMQYTSASFAEPLLEPFAPIVSTRVAAEPPVGLFPTRATHEQQIGDLAGERLVVPITRRVLRYLAQLRVIQQGRIHLYLMYIAVTLVALLAWELLA